MPPSPLRRYLPLAILLLLLGAGLIAWLPGAIRVARLRSATQQMLAAAAQGDLAKVVAAVDPAQQAEVQALFDQYVPADYAQGIASLKLVRSGLEGPEGWTEVVCRFEGGAEGVYQGRLHWTWQAGRWQWDFLGSYGAAFTLSEPQWQSLRELIPDAGRL